MLLYMCVPMLLVATGATFLNLSLLTSDFFSVAIGVLLFGDAVPGIYAVAFACTVGGLVVFHVKTGASSADDVRGERGLAEAEAEEEVGDDAQRLLLDEVASGEGGGRGSTRV